MFNRKIFFLLLGILLRSPAWSKVLIRWSEGTLPAKTLGVAEIVIPWDTNTTALLPSAGKYGYQVYVEVSAQQAVDAATLISKESAAGLIISPGTAQEAAAAVRKLRTTDPTLTMLVPNANGKQPQMRGQTISSRNGILQISSPTAQPWLDSNLAMVRFEQGFYPEQRPLFSFQWELTDSLQQQNGPSVEDYSLAVAEAGAIHADLILNLDGRLQKGLVENQPAAWTMWKQLRSYLNFSSAPDLTLRSWANVGVATDDYNTAYEPMNLMARHNIPFRVLDTVGLSPGALEGLSIVAVFTAPDQRAVDTLYNFAGQGGTVILVDLKGKYPWQSVQAVQTAEHAISYPVGKGRVVELSEPISDPETFAQDVRRLMRKDQVLISAWNALTTIAIPYRDDGTGETVVELVNYAEEAMRVQVQLKGVFSSIRYESPDRGCCQDLSPVQHDGFTDFVVPSLLIAGRVRLKTAGRRQALPSNSCKGSSMNSSGSPISTLSRTWTTIRSNHNQKEKINQRWIDNFTSVSSYQMRRVADTLSAETDLDAALSHLPACAARQKLCFPLRPSPSLPSSLCFELASFTLIISEAAC